MIRRTVHTLRGSMLTLALAASNVNSFAVAPAPKTPFDSELSKATMKKPPSSGLQMGSLRLLLEKTTLDDVRQEVASGEIAHHGDAGESEYWLCYTSFEPMQIERIWIIASGEMGGPKHHITSVSAELIPSGSATKECPTLPKKMKPVRLDNRLWLNSTLPRVRQLLGEPSAKKVDWISFNYEGKVPGNCGREGFDMVSWLLLQSAKGRVTALQLGRVTSC